MIASSDGEVLRNATEIEGCYGMMPTPPLCVLSDWNMSCNLPFLFRIPRESRWESTGSNKCGWAWGICYQRFIKRGWAVSWSFLFSFTILIHVFSAQIIGVHGVESLPINRYMIFPFYVVHEWLLLFLYFRSTSTTVHIPEGLPTLESGRVGYWPHCLAGSDYVCTGLDWVVMKTIDVQESGVDDLLICILASCLMLIAVWVVMQQFDIYEKLDSSVFAVFSIEVWCHFNVLEQCRCWILWDCCERVRGDYDSRSPSRRALAKNMRIRGMQYQQITFALTSC